MPSDSNLVDIKIRVSPEILEQAKRVAGVNGVKLAEQGRWFFLHGLAEEQAKLIAAGRWPIQEDLSKEEN